MVLRSPRHLVVTKEVTMKVDNVDMKDVIL